MRFVTFDQAASHFIGRRVAIVGSAPSSLTNALGFVDGHDVVVRVNNYKTGPAQGVRTDVHYSFYGNSIRKSAEDLAADGVKLCMCKCPNGKPIESPWHERTGRLLGIDFTFIYQRRANWWFCDTFIPDAERFVRSFEMLDRHIPTTGLAAILDVLDCQPRSVYLTGFDFFSSGVHNVDERWRPGDPDDPIGHRPDLEAAWLKRNVGAFPITFDAKLQELLG